MFYAHWQTYSVSIALQSSCIVFIYHSDYIFSKRERAIALKTGKVSLGWAQALSPRLLTKIAILRPIWCKCEKVRLKGIKKGKRRPKGGISSPSRGPKLSVWGSWLSRHWQYWTVWVKGANGGAGVGVGGGGGILRGKSGGNETISPEA